MISASQFEPCAISWAFISKQTDVGFARSLEKGGQLFRIPPKYCKTWSMCPAMDGWISW